MGIPQAGDRKVSECKGIVKRCSSGRPISMTRVESEVSFLCYDSEHSIFHIPPPHLLLSALTHERSRIRSIRRQVRSTPPRPRNRRMGRSGLLGFIPVPLRPLVLLRLRRNQAPRHRTLDPDNPS